MNLIELINFLEIYPLGYIAKIGVSEPYSWRGSYEYLAFEPIKYISIEQMLKHAKMGYGTFTGYKGGYFEMNARTTVYLSSGYSNPYLGNETEPFKLTPFKLKNMIENGVFVYDINIEGIEEYMEEENENPNI